MTVATLEQPNSKGDVALEIIDRYRSTVDDHTRLDPLETEFNTLAHYLRSMGAGSLYLLHADDNRAGAFKWRGAFNKVAALQKRGVEEIVVPSAGNHARGAVLAAKQFGLRANIVVPVSAPPAKKEGLRDLWPDNDKLRIIPEGDTFDQSLEYALDHPELGTLVHPYDDPDVIAGQGTIADDLKRLAGEPIDHIVLPVGGGGLLAGIVDRFHQLNNSHTHVHAVLPTGSDSLSRSFAAGEPIVAEAPNQRYGGSAVRKIGAETFRIIWENRDRITVHHVTDEMVDAIIASYQRDLLRLNTPSLEATTLVDIAGLKDIATAHPGESIAAIGTGHNAPLFNKNNNISIITPENGVEND